MCAAATPRLIAISGLAVAQTCLRNNANTGRGLPHSTRGHKKQKYCKSQYLQLYLTIYAILISYSPPVVIYLTQGSAWYPLFSMTFKYLTCKTATSKAES